MCEHVHRGQPVTVSSFLSSQNQIPRLGTLSPHDGLQLNFLNCWWLILSKRKLGLLSFLKDLVKVQETKKPKALCNFRHISLSNICSYLRMQMFPSAGVHSSTITPIIITCWYLLCTFMKEQLNQIVCIYYIP